MSPDALTARPGRRERTKLANREAILDAAREVFAEIGYDGASVRDVIRRTDLAAGTFYNYFPDKESVFRALIEDAGEQVREQVREARRAGATFEEVILGGFRAYFGFVAEDPVTFELTQRNAGTVREMFSDPALGSGIDELREDLDRLVLLARAPAMDTEYVAAAMAGAAVEIGLRMLARDPVDPDAAADFATRLFLGGLPQ